MSDQKNIEQQLSAINKQLGFLSIVVAFFVISSIFSSCYAKKVEIDGGIIYVCSADRSKDTMAVRITNLDDIRDTAGTLKVEVVGGDDS